MLPTSSNLRSPSLSSNLGGEDSSSPPCSTLKLHLTTFSSSLMDSSTAASEITEAQTELPNPSAAPPASTDAHISPPNVVDSSTTSLTSTQANTPNTAAAPPRHGSNQQQHPPYAEMIISAIRGLDEKKGSSKKAIAKYIDATYTNLPATHLALLAHHLKRLKKSGKILMVKHSYKLPKSASFKFASSAPKRGRGRPPKPKPISIGPDGGPSLPKRSRGRPPKPKPVSKGPDGLVLPKRGRGRPPKSKPTMVPGSNRFVGAVKLRAGRRPKSRPIVIAGSYGVVAPPKPRRPPKPRPFVVSSSDGPVGPPRPRGRPRKNTGLEPVRRPRKIARSDDGGGLSSVVSPEKRRGRGRPPKVGGPAKLKRAVGRPKKFSMGE